MLKAYREAVVDPVAGPTLVQAVQKVSASGDYKLGGKHYKRVPRGSDPEHPNAELLCFNGLTAGEEVLIPEEFYSGELLDYCYKRYEDLYPIQHWLFELTQGLARK